MVTVNPSESNSYVTGTTGARGIIFEPELVDVPVTSTGRPAPLSRVPWGAVIAGSLTALSLIALSASLAAACDVTPFTVGGAGAATYSAGAGWWAVITFIVAFFFGGMVASYLSSAHRNNSALYGLLTWVLGVPLLGILSANAIGLFHMAMTNDALRGGIVMTRGEAWAAFLSLILGLIAAVIGGVSMRKDEILSKSR